MKPGGASPEPPAGQGGTTAADGTPVAVDVSAGSARGLALVLVAGPLIWTIHFVIVYLVAEAGCTGDGPGLNLFDPPVPRVVTLAATGVAAIASLACAAWAHRRWQAARGRSSGASSVADAQDRGSLLAFAGFLLSLLSFVTVLFVGLPALVLAPC